MKKRRRVATSTFCTTFFGWWLLCSIFRHRPKFWTQLVDLTHRNNPLVEIKIKNLQMKQISTFSSINYYINVKIRFSSVVNLSKFNTPNKSNSTKMKSITIMVFSSFFILHMERMEHTMHLTNNLTVTGTKQWTTKKIFMMIENQFSIWLSRLNRFQKWFEFTIGKLSAGN